MADDLRGRELAQFIDLLTNQSLRAFISQLSREGIIDFNHANEEVIFNPARVTRERFEGMVQRGMRGESR